jgi:hypothetical protein
MADKVAGDARYRPFRAAAWIGYVGLVTLFGLTVTVGVTRSVFRMTPSRPTPSPTPLGVSECFERERQLWAELDAQRRALSSAPEVRKVDVEWTAWRQGWVTRQREAEADCAVDQPGREELKTVFAKLTKLMDLYTTHAVQFAGEIGPTLDALKATLRPAGPSPHPTDSGRAQSPTGDPAR